MLSIVIGLFVGVCSIFSTTVVGADWFLENDAPIALAPLNFSANLLNANAQEVLPYTRMGSDEALEFWPEVEEGEEEKIVWAAGKSREAAMYEIFHDVRSDADDIKFLLSERGDVILESMIQEEMGRSYCWEDFWKERVILMGVAQPD